MGDLWSWLTGLHWWQYLLIAYGCGAVLQVFMIGDHWSVIVGMTREFQQAQQRAPRMMAIMAAVMIILAALFWPIFAFEAGWWRGLVGAKNVDGQD